MEERLKAGPLWEGDSWGLVFTTEAGRPLNHQVVTHHFQQSLTRAGLPKWRFHDQRHAAASFMLAQGVPLRVVMEVLGHSTINVTADVYGHLAPELSRDATARVGEVLFGRS